MTARLTRGLAPLYGTPGWINTMTLAPARRAPVRRTPSAFQRAQLWVLYRAYVFLSWFAAWRLNSVRVELQQFHDARTPMTAMALTLRGQEQRLRAQWLHYETRAALTHRCRRSA